MDLSVTAAPFVVDLAVLDACLTEAFGAAFHQAGDTPPLTGVAVTLEAVSFVGFAVAVVVHPVTDLAAGEDLSLASRPHPLGVAVLLARAANALAGCARGAIEATADGSGDTGFGAADTLQTVGRRSLRLAVSICLAGTSDLGEAAGAQMQAAQEREEQTQGSDMSGESEHETYHLNQGTLYP